MAKNLWGLILAAGEGKRMRSDLPKVAHPICGKPMLAYIVDSALQLTDQILVVVGHQADQVKEILGPRRDYVLQREQLGTGHAVMQALDSLPREGRLMVLCGDTPLLTGDLLAELLSEQENCAASVLTAIHPDPSGYGRVLRGPEGDIERIVEDADATEAERAVKEINTGTYCFDLALLRRYLKGLSSSNAQGEYYLPDVISSMRTDGLKSVALVVDDYSKGLGINNRAQLAAASAIIQRKLLDSLMVSGVTVENPGSVKLDYSVKVGSDTVIKVGSVIESGSVIGANCIIGPHAHIVNSVIGDGALVQQSYVEGSSVEKGKVIGPFACLKGSPGV